MSNTSKTPTWTMTARNLTACLGCVACLASPAHGQSVAAEAAFTGGSSTDDVSVVAAQGRVFGELRHGIRFFGEAAWAGRSADIESDAFGAAYPYENRVDIIEAYAERIFRPRSALVGVRAGRFRTPFGIYHGSDHAYLGFLRAPLIRYSDLPALANTFLEHGVNLVAGAPRLTVEATLGAPADVGEYVRRSAFDAVGRVQGYAGPFIAGISYIRTSPTNTADLAPGHAHFTGVDVRWMRNGVQLRGEWITGRPFDGATTAGWYTDVLVHRPGMGPITAVARFEKLDHEHVHDASHEKLNRQTFGTRVLITEALSLIVNVIHQTGAEDEFRPNALDIGLTWSVRTR